MKLPFAHELHAIFSFANCSFFVQLKFPRSFLVDLSSACHLKMRGDRKIDRLTQGRRSMMIDYYWTVSNVNCKPCYLIHHTPLSACEGVAVDCAAGPRIFVVELVVSNKQVIK